MNSQQAIIFAVVAVLTLGGVFFVAALGYFDGVDPGGRVEQVAELKDERNIYEPSEVDPLITPAAKIYKALIREDDPVRGDVDAELVIMEFADFECAYCADMYDDLARILADYEGEVKLVWKDFPNPVHLEARRAALAARCADGQGSFWEYHDYLFANQGALSRELYNQIALELELDLVEFNSCLDGQEYITQVGQGLADGQELEVDATPYLFIGNQRVDYALEYDKLKEIVEWELGR